MSNYRSKGRPQSLPFVLAALLFGSLLLSPFLSVSPLLPAFRPDEAIAVLILFVSFVSSGPITDILAQGLKLTWPLICFACAMTMTSFFAAIAYHSFTPRDLMEVLFPIKYMIFGLAGTFVGALCSDRQIKKLIFWIMVFGLTAATLGFLQFLGVSAVVKQISALYVPKAAQTHMFSMQTGGRVIGTVGNANHYAAILGFVLLVATGSFVSSKSRRVLPMFVILFVPLVIIATISRANFIAIPIAVALLLVQASGRRKNWLVYLKVLLAVGVLASVGYSYFQVAGSQFRERRTTDVSAFDRRVDSLSNFSERGVYSIRMHHFIRKLGFWYESPVFGVGASKTGPHIGSDDEYASMLAKYGTLGFLMLLLYYFRVYKIMRKSVRLGAGVAPFPAVVMAFVLQILIDNISGGAFYQAQVFGLLAFTSGVAHGSAYSYQVYSRRLSGGLL